MRRLERTIQLGQESLSWILETRAAQVMFLRYATHSMHRRTPFYRNGSDEGAVKGNALTERKTQQQPEKVKYLPSTLVVLPTLNTLPD